MSTRAALTRLASHASPIRSHTRLLRGIRASSSSAPQPSNSNASDPPSTQSDKPSAANPPPTRQKPKLTASQMDEELRRRLEEMSGDGGAAGVDYEDGKPVAMKRGVRANMFRLI